MSHALRPVVPEDPDAPLPGMIGCEPAMREVYRQARRLAPTDLPVVVAGETGTGKELVARAIHKLSPRTAGPFIDVNCAAIAEGVAEGELFGWERGAFTGAHERVLGLLEIADGGTLFLDEACSLPQGLQGKLLRALEYGEFRRVGGRTLVRSDFRLVLAVARALDDLLASRTFRRDFGYRVSGAVITLPPLRARVCDVRLLAERFLEEASCEARRPLRWHEDALATLERHAWPGNVRELRMLVRRLAVLTEHDVISVEGLWGAGFAPAHSASDPGQLKAALDACGGNWTRAACALDIPRTTLRDRLLKQ